LAKKLNFLWHTTHKGVSIEDDRNQGRGKLVKCGHFACKGERELFRCGRPHFLVQKTWIFEILMCPHGLGGVETVRT